MDARLGSGAALAEITRAARVLWVRSRREATGWLVGGFESAFRGGGIEFEESRPYAPGDDVRSIDWNALARTGAPWVKRFREERAQLVLLALDVSASMGFGTTGRSKLAVAARAAALLAAAAGRAGDLVGLVAFADGVRGSLPPARGDAHTWRVVRSAAAWSERAGGATSLAPVSEWLRAHARRRAIVVLLSDFRGFDPDVSDLAGRHDVVSIVVEDPRELALLAAGRVRLRDPEGRGRWLLGTGRRARERYAAAAATRRHVLARRLRRAGGDVLWLPTHADPLRVLARFFAARTARRRAPR
ncbi:MAG TPA: DUF58 domain-containing protein [Myxococcota bacterium]|nr:DUF58 domain-containing protein [Myxococcota bacterium]